jgi:hypothetical protein
MSSPKTRALFDRYNIVSGKRVLLQLGPEL